MAIYIKIQKIKEAEKVYYYHVKTNDFGGSNFYIGINPSNNHISFFSSDDFSRPETVIDLNDKEKSIIVPGIHAAIVSRVILQAYKAIQSKQFLNQLDYAA